MTRLTRHTNVYLVNLKKATNMIEIRHSGLNQYGADEVNKHFIKKYGVDRVNRNYNGKLPYNVGDKFLYKLPTKKQYKNVKRFNKLGLENFVCTWEGMKIKLKHLSIEVYEVELKYSRVM